MGQPDDMHVLCTNHNGRKVRMVEDSDDTFLVYCPDCSFTCQNYVKYPWVHTLNVETGEERMRNVITGEEVRPPSPADYIRLMKAQLDAPADRRKMEDA